MSCPDSARCVANEWRLSLPARGVMNQAHAAIFVLRARAARKSNGRVGLVGDLLCLSHEWPLLATSTNQWPAKMLVILAITVCWDFGPRGTRISDPKTYRRLIAGAGRCRCVDCFCTSEAPCPGLRSSVRSQPEDHHIMPSPNLVPGAHLFSAFNRC